MRCDGLVVCHARRVDGLQPRQRRAGHGLGRGGLRRVVHRAALADGARARRRARRRADGPQPVRSAAVDVSRRRAARGRAGARAELAGAGSCRDAADLAQVPGSSFYRRLREKFGRLARVAVTSSCQACCRRAGSVGGALVDRRACCHELRVENLLLIERAELRLAPGLNVLTGETGAGKTVLAHALDLLLGGRPRSGHRAAGRRGGLRRGRLRAAGRAARRARRGGCRRTPTRSCSPGGSAPTGRTRALPQRPLGDGGRPARRRGARSSPSTASTSTAG